MVPAIMSLARRSLRQGVEDRVWREHQGEVKWINWIDESTRNTGTRTTNSVIGLSDFRDYHLCKSQVIIE